MIGYILHPFQVVLVERLEECLQTDPTLLAQHPHFVFDLAHNAARTLGRTVSQR